MRPRLTARRGGQGPAHGAAGRAMAADATAAAKEHLEGGFMVKKTQLSALSADMKSVPAGPIGERGLCGLSGYTAVFKAGSSVRRLGLLLGSDGDLARSTQCEALRAASVFLSSAQRKKMTSVLVLSLQGVLRDASYGLELARSNFKMHRSELEWSNLENVLYERPLELYCVSPSGA